jgi:hypothetical protein
MDLMKSLKSLVVEETEVVNQPNTTLVRPPQPFPAPPPLAYSSQPVDQDAVKALDEKMLAKFQAAIIAKNPKFYTKLNDLLSTLAEDMPSEQARYKTAIKLLYKEGATVPSLISDLDLCISAIEDNSKDFSQSVEKKLNERTSSRQNNIATIDQTLTTKQQQIQTLQADIATLTQQKQEETNLISVETNKINQSKERFSIIYNQLHDQLAKQKENISNYSK